MKRLVVCCDGTWQAAEQEVPTNVLKLAETIQPNDPIEQQPQIVRYNRGLGTGEQRLNQIGGGAFGWGIDQEIENAYDFLCFNYQEGDEIYLFGFSRGAYTVRSLAGLIRVAGGLLPREEVQKVPDVYAIYRSNSDLARKERAMRALSSAMRPAKITVLGCWDTVGSLGVPRTLPLLSRFINKKYEFHDCQISNIIEHALHAVAIDENRTVFDYTPMEQSAENITRGQTLHQVWFSGDHGAVGGGNAATAPLADAALLWMIHSIQDTLKLGLKFDLKHVEYDSAKVDRRSNRLVIHANPEVYVEPQQGSLLLRLTGTSPRQLPNDAALHESVFKRWHAPAANYRPTHLPSTLVAQLNASRSV
jgi:uncharacterized protein (DUF2235 family)